MKRPPKPFAVEKRSLKPTGRRPETRIKAVRADAPKPAPPPKLTWAQYIERQIEIATYRIRNPNDPRVLDDAHEAMVFRDELVREAASAMVGRTTYGEETITLTSKTKGSPLSRLFQRFLPKLPIIRPKAGDMSAPRSVREALRRLKE